MEIKIKKIDKGSFGVCQPVEFRLGLSYAFAGVLDKLAAKFFRFNFMERRL